jgi:glycosyltransferase involved in cell wall biosynthesis
MRVVYTAPNRGHHYRYAAALQAAGHLHAFVSGFPRISPRAKVPAELAAKTHHADYVQTVYIASLKAKAPAQVSNWLAYMSKSAQDYACRKYVKDCDIFLFYNGSGLRSSRYGKRRGAISIVEAVNSHVSYQEDILREEHERAGLPWLPFPVYEKERRLQEYEEADYILLPSDFVRNSFLEKGFPAHKLLKVPFGFENMAGSAPAPAKEPGTFTVLYVGSISVRKGIRYLLDAFARLQHPNKRLLLVGPDANDGALAGTILPPGAVLTGSLKGDELTRADQSASVFCLPSIEEGLALVLGEALSFGLPIIATTNTGATDLFTDGHEGYIVPICSSDAILEKLQLLADNPDVLQQLGAASYAKAESLDGWQQTGQNLVSALQGVYAHARSH